ncbi:hypothetical protein IN820_21405 [Pseudomonas sp. AL-54]|nr:hypothetical protein [Pseudomonas lopnurensis]
MPSCKALPLRRPTERFEHMAGALAQAWAENERLGQALLALQERERTQLAQALHDGLGQCIAGIRAQACLLKLVMEQPQQVASTAACLDDNCRQLQDGFSRLTRELYPVMLEHMELDEAVRLLGEQWQAAQGIACELYLDSHLPALPLPIKTHLYRLLQEALTNVARHAQASMVRVRLQRRGARLRLLLRDNGRGSHAHRPGIGLRSMAERARSLGGELYLSQRPGNGWAIYLDIPLTEALAP